MRNSVPRSTKSRNVRSRPVRVLVTGATGFVGCHTAAALLGDGHDVRALVRSSSRLDTAMAPFDVGPVDHVVGDVTDEVAVEKAITGCDAVVHSAAVFTLDKSRAGEIYRTNVGGTELVLGSAVQHELDPVIHV